MAHYDVIIKNGLALSGEGGKPQRVDVGVSGGEIKKMGGLEGDGALKTIDASGKFVCPGFIDLTAHSDTHWTLFTDPGQESLLRQGVTTVAGGSCGSSIAPLIGKAGLESAGKWVDVSRTNVNWQTFEEFLYELERRRVGVNFAATVGLETLFASASGNPEQMAFLLEKSMDEGAFGLSTNLGSRGARSLSDNDLAKLFAAAAKKGGMTKHHLEDEGGNVLPAVSRLIQLARKSGAPVHLSHFKVLGRSSWHLFDAALKMIRKARGGRVFGFGGIAMTLDFFPYEKTGSDLFALMPRWLKRMNKKDAEAVLRDGGSEERKRAAEHLKGLTLHYDRITIASSFHGGDIGKTVAEISESSGLAPEEVILRLLSLNHLHVSMFSEVISMDNVKKLFGEDFAAASSDGVGYDSANFAAGGASLRRDLPHPRSFGAFPRFLRMAVRETGALDWGEAVRRVTGLPASVLGLRDRGTLKKGKKADIVVFNPETVSDRAGYSDPFRFPEGVDAVVVNGRVVVEDGKFSGDLAGEVLRKK